MNEIKNNLGQGVDPVMGGFVMEQTPNIDVRSRKPVTRRDFLKLGYLVGGVAMGLDKVDHYFGLSTQTPELIKSMENPKEKQRFELSDNLSYLESVEAPQDGYPVNVNTSREYKFPNSPRWFPDTRTSWIRTKSGKLLIFASAGVDSVRMEGTDWSNLRPAEIVLSPDKTTTESGFNGYRGFSTVVERDDGSLVAVMHREDWQSEGEHFPFTASIEVSLSKNEGRTWSQPQIVLTGHEMIEGLNDVQGVGQPGGIVTENDQLVVYYTDWQGPDNIHMAKVPLDQAEDPNSWEKWVEGKGFVEPGIGGDSTPVVTSENSYVALPQILWDNNRGTYVMLNEQDKGFYIRTSVDGVNWSEGQMIVQVPSPLSTRRIEQDWYSYPTLIGLDAPNQFTLGQKNMLLASRGIWSINAHRGVLLPVEIE